MVHARLLVPKQTVFLSFFSNSNFLPLESRMIMALEEIIQNAVDLEIVIMKSTPGVDENHTEQAREDR